MISNGVGFVGVWTLVRLAVAKETPLDGRDFQPRWRLVASGGRLVASDSPNVRT